MTWRDVAGCLDVDPELFFPTGITRPALLQVEEAKAICHRCEVAEIALEEFCADCLRRHTIVEMAAIDHWIDGDDLLFFCC